jgi:hypothetical protein
LMAVSYVDGCQCCQMSAKKGMMAKASQKRQP